MEAMMAYAPAAARDEALDSEVCAHALHATNALHAGLHMHGGRWKLPAALPSLSLSSGGVA